MELWDRETQAGVTTQTLYDESEDRLFMTTHQNEQPVADYCKARREGFNGFGGLVNQVASVPMVTILEWKKQGFDAFNASIKEIQEKLQKDNLNKFLAYEKGYKKYHNGLTIK